MRLVHQIIRAFAISTALATAFSLAGLAVQLYVWRNIPPVGPVSLPLAVSPQYAIRNSACVFGTVFLLGLPFALIHCLRPR